MKPKAEIMKVMAIQQVALETLPLSAEKDNSASDSAQAVRSKQNVKCNRCGMRARLRASHWQVDIEREGHIERDYLCGHCCFELGRDYQSWIY